MVQRGDETGSAAPRRSPIYKDLVLLQLAALTFLADQFTKFLVRWFLEPCGPIFCDSVGDGFLRIIHTFNTGSAFGLFRGQNIPLVLVSVVGITILVLIYRSQRRPGNLLRLSLGLQLGGATGNLLDRVRLGHVTDFADVGAWPVFNVADASIVTGLVLLAWLLLWAGGSRGTSGGAGVAVAGEDTGLESKYRAGYAWCPMCDGDMEAVSKGWKCSSCGARERVVPRSDAPMASGSAPAQDGNPAGEERESGVLPSALAEGEIPARPGGPPVGE